MLRKATGLILAALAGTMAVPAQAVDHDLAAGQVMAAARIADDCEGIFKIGNGNNQSFVMAATELLAAQGYGKQKMRLILFYGESNSLQALGEHALAAREVKTQDRASLCRFGKAIAGKNDVIGQFLVKGE